MNDKQTTPPTAPAAGSDDGWCDDEGCYLCGGSGYVVTCIDDLCRNVGECMHGDGESPCPECFGIPACGRAVEAAMARDFRAHHRRHKRTMRLRRKSSNAQPSGGEEKSQ